MMIAVKLHGILRDYRPEGLKTDLLNVKLDELARVRDAIERLGIPSESVQAVFLNDEPAGLDAALKDGDHLRLFPPVVGGADRPLRVFIAGVMQGSRRENNISAQDYRRQIGRCLQAHLTNVEIVDPLQLHPNSVEYDEAAARRTLIEMAKTAGRSDAVVAFVPEASMGTALEMWTAYESSRPIFTISPLIHNWVVKCLSTRIFADVESFCAFVAAGEFEARVRAAV
jgi:sulfur carrier protein ThiS